MEMAKTSNKKRICAYLGCRREARHRGIYGYYCDKHYLLAASFYEYIKRPEFGVR